MRVRIINLWEEIRSSYWFVPMLMGAIAVAASFVTLALDNEYSFELGRELGLVWGGGPEGARGLLETVAGSMITVAGVTFSITIVALSQASSQFGPRLLRNFMRDTGNQIVLGTFIATFTYCLLILRTIRADGDQEFVPYISITIGILLALFSLGVLIYFIHHAALSIQAPYVIAEVAEDLFHTIDQLFPGQVGRSKDDIEEAQAEDDIPDNFMEEACPVEVERSGYLQAVDMEKLLHIAESNDLILCLKNRPGHFMIEGYPVVLAWPEERLDEEHARQIQDAFIIGRERTHTQDLEFAIDQLVEVAVRSLSTGINDPFTAINCIDWLGAAVARLAEKDFPSPYRYDRQGFLRLYIERPFTFEGVVNAAFNQIRQYADRSAAVRIRLLEAIALISAHTKNEADRQVLRQHALMIEQASREVLPEEKDREDVEERFEDVIENQIEQALD